MDKKCIIVGFVGLIVGTCATYSAMEYKRRNEIRELTKEYKSIVSLAIDGSYDDGYKDGYTDGKNGCEPLVKESDTEKNEDIREECGTSTEETSSDEVLDKYNELASKYTPKPNDNSHIHKHIVGYDEYDDNIFKDADPIPFTEPYVITHEEWNDYGGDYPFIGLTLYSDGYLVNDYTDERYEPMEIYEMIGERNYDEFYDDCRNDQEKYDGIMYVRSDYYREVFVVTYEPELEWNTIYTPEDEIPSWEEMHDPVYIRDELGKEDREEHRKRMEIYKIQNHEVGQTSYQLVTIVHYSTGEYVIEPDNKHVLINAFLGEDFEDIYHEQCYLEGTTFFRNDRRKQDIELIFTTDKYTDYDEE